MGEGSKDALGQKELVVSSGLKVDSKRGSESSCRSSEDECGTTRYVSVHIYIYSIYTYIYAHMCRYIYIYTHVQIHIYVYTCNTHMCTYTVYACMHACIHASCIHAYMHTCIHAYIHTYISTHTLRTLPVFLVIQSPSHQLPIEARRLEYDCPPTPKFSKKRKQPKSSQAHIPILWSLLKSV